MIECLRLLLSRIFSFYLLRYVICELKYMLTGAAAILEDITYREKNKCELYNMDGKVAVVTGGARGIGGDVVKKLLQCNVHVIIGCRKISAANEIVEKIRESGVMSGSWDAIELDLTSFASVRKFASQVSDKTKKLHILVNNAGIMFPPFVLTEDGYESQWAVNYLGPFYLTHLLFPLMHEGSLESECRIVNVSSCAHKICKKINYNKLNSKSYYITGIAYAYSKAAQILSTIYLSNLFKEKGINISVFSVHPGIVNTDLFNGTTTKFLMPWVLKYFCKNSEEGATSVIYPCISPELTGISGQYLSNCKTIKPSQYTLNLKEQTSLFLYSLDQLKIKEFGKED